MAEGPVTITIKAGAGYEAPWLVISGEDWDEVVLRLAGVPGITEEQVTGLAQAFTSVIPVGSTGTERILQAVPDVAPNVVVPDNVPVPQPDAPGLAPQAETKPVITNPTAPATEKQLALIAKLRGSPQPGITKQQASDFIEQLMAAKG